MTTTNAFRSTLTRLGIGLALLSLGPSVVCADLVKLNHGGEIRGKLIRTPMVPGQKGPFNHVRIETLTGATIVVAAAETQFTANRSMAIEEYETKAHHVADTKEAHWELAEWCKTKGLTSQRSIHLLKVVEKDPDHEKAQLALDRMWHNGEWVDREEHMAAQGYVKYKNRYITTQELDLIQKTAEVLEDERKWFQNVKLWHAWIVSQNESRRQQALTAFQQIDDVDAAPAVIKHLCEEQRRDLRLLGITVLSKLPCVKAVTGLVKMSLFEMDPELRYNALNGIDSSQFVVAQAAYVKELRNENNAVVSRAAAALGRVGNDLSITPLIDALVTNHKYYVPSNQPAGNSSYSFGTDGSFGSTGTSLPPQVEAAVRTGQLPQGYIIANPDVVTPRKSVLVKVSHNNPDVLSTLQKLTRQNFGYDKRTWHLWWSAAKAQGKADIIGNPGDPKK